MWVRVCDSMKLIFEKLCDYGYVETNKDHIV